MSEHDNARRIVVHPAFGEDARNEIIQIKLDGRLLPAMAGESIATALWAKGIVVSRSMLESASPRGMFCGVGRCPDCMMTVDGRLNVRTCVTPVRAGMTIETAPEDQRRKECG